MTITIDQLTSATLIARARQSGIAPETLAMNILRHAIADDPTIIEPHDEWERNLLLASSDCGVSLSNEALSSEGIY